jgi:DNA polymerase-1
MERKSFYIIDGSAYFFRAYHAIRNLSTSKGLPTNAIYGFIQMLLRVVRVHHPDYLVIAFDTKAPTFRHAAYDAYKAHRPPMPDDLSVQIPYIHRAVEALGLFSILKEGYEADDLIGTLAKQGEVEGLLVTLVSGDKDMLQLLSPAITLYDTLKEKRFTEETVRDRFGVPPSQLIEIMGLMGDVVDNVPGVHGVGEKTAIELIAQFGTMEQLFLNLDQVKRVKLREALERDQAAARLSRQLVTIDTHCPIDFNLHAYHVHPPDPARLIPFLKELEFTALVREFSLVAATNPAQSPVGAPLVGAQETRSGAYQQVTPAEVLLRCQKENQVAFDFFCDESAGLCGIAFAFSEGDPLYTTFAANALPPELSTLFSSDQIMKIGHDLKPLFVFLGKHRLTLVEPLFDTMIAAYLLNPSRRNFSLSSVAPDGVALELPLDKAPGRDPLVAGVVTPLCRRATAILSLMKQSEPSLQEQGLLPLLREIELPLIPVLARIEQVGVKLDLALLSDLSKELDRRLTESTQRIYALANREFNLNSPKQLGQILFDELHLPPLRKTKTGYSTDEEVLTRLALQHDLPLELLTYRQETKLKSTYVDALPKLAVSGNRIHTRLNQTVAATGRLSSSDPNLQNIPMKGEWGPQIRRAFIPEAGSVFLCADYSQIELRILAHLSEDPALCSAFHQGGDVHLRTAMEIFSLSQEAITKEMRRVAKTVNFGIVYGMSPFGLSSSLGISQKEAKRYIDLYFEHYHGVKQFIEKSLEEARQTCQVTTLFARRRTVPELASRDKKSREAGERIAINTPIQGSAADMIKIAMINIDDWMRKTCRQSRMILQVHDELLFEVPEGELPQMRAEVISRMENVVSLKVPIKVDVGVGTNWWAAKSG